MVSVPCVAGVAFRLTRRPGTGTNPLLAMPRHDDLIGAIVAHEIGHLLGIRHAPAGLMRASLETDDMIALRRGKLRFSPAEAGRMRIAALLAGEERLRSSAAGSPPDPPRQMRMLEDEKRGLSHHRGGVTQPHVARDAIRRRDRARRPTRGHARRASYGRRHRCPGNSSAAPPATARRNLATCPWSAPASRLFRGRSARHRPAAIRPAPAAPPARPPDPC
jgi:hypothetical protein